MFTLERNTVENHIGALWLKQSKAGKTFMSGELDMNGEKIKIVVFKNNKDGVETRPDYQIFKSEEREQKQEEINLADIPF